MYRKFFKILFDFILSLLAIIVLSPLLLLISLLVRIKLGSPVIFKQKRPGLSEKIFTLYKFRSMTDDKDKDGKLLSDSIRLTKFGKWLRSTSLDELPELFNIIKGDMSIVGPRPQLIKDMMFMTSEQRKRHTVRPGLTGLAQIKGRNNISWEEKFKNDHLYLEKITLFHDLEIILKTAIKVFNKDDISTEGMETAEDLGDYLLRIGKVDQFEYDKNQELSRELLVK